MQGSESLLLKLLSLSSISSKSTRTLCVPLVSFYYFCGFGDKSSRALTPQIVVQSCETDDAHRSGANRELTNRRVKKRLVRIND